MDIIKDTKYKGKKIYVYLSTIQYNDNTGTVNINKHKFDELIIKLLKKYGKYKKMSQIYYEYYNKKYIITNGFDRKVYSSQPCKVKIDGKRIFNIVEEKLLSIEYFPIISKYHNIMKKNKMMYTYDNFTISLITESYPNNSPNYYVEVSFTNTNCDYNKLEEILSFLSSYV